MVSQTYWVTFRVSTVQFDMQNYFHLIFRSPTTQRFAKNQNQRKQHRNHRAKTNH